jgi:hypothetical protein
LGSDQRLLLGTSYNVNWLHIAFPIDLKRYPFYFKPFAYTFGFGLLLFYAAATVFQSYHGEVMGERGRLVMVLMGSGGTIFNYIVLPH